MSEQNEAFLKSILRGPRFSNKERLLTSYLLRSAHANDKVMKVSLICEACLLDRENSVKLGIDMDLVQVLSSVSASLGTSQSFRTGDPENAGFRVLWNFEATKENFERYIQPWAPKAGSLYVFRSLAGPVGNSVKHATFSCKYCGKFLAYMKEEESAEMSRERFESCLGINHFNRTFECPSCDRVLYKVDWGGGISVIEITEGAFYVYLDEWSKFFAYSSVLTKEGLAQLVNAFTLHYMPTIQDWMMKLVSTVDKEIFREAFTSDEKGESSTNTEEEGDANQMG